MLGVKVHYLLMLQSSKRQTRLNSTHLFIGRSPNRKELQETAYNHPVGINFTVSI